VVVEARRRQPDALRDIADGCARKTALGKERLGTVEDPFAGVRAVLGLVGQASLRWAEPRNPLNERLFTRRFTFDIR
jgi:hypothetical protein